MKILYCSMGKLCLYIAYLIFFYILLAAWRPVQAQASYSIPGRVLSADNQEPLVGASVLIKGSANGATTDRSGYFGLSATRNRVTLVLSFIGYRSVDTVLVLPLKKELKIIMQQDLTTLEEVRVSTGYWETSKKLSTGNISKVNAAVIEKQPVTNVMQALIGRMPGVSVQQTSGLAGAPFNITIRGRNSIRTDGNNPLYIIDGVPFTASMGTALGGEVYSGGISPMNSINPADIESIEILKDADATAIYGSRGANGVVLVSTKKGKAEKTRVELNFSQGAGKITRRMDLLNTSQYLLMRREAFANDATEPSISNAPDLLEWDTARYTNWQKVLVGGTAHTTNAQASVSGGNENTRFSLGTAYYRETTVFPGSFAFLRGSGHFNLNHSSTDKKLTMNLSVSYSADQNNLMGQNLASQALTIAPNAPELLTTAGELNWANNTWQNPLSYLRQKYKATNENFLTALAVSYKLVKDLEVKANIGYTTLQTQQLTTSPVSFFNPAYGVKSGESAFGNSAVKTWILEPQLEYNKQLRRTGISVLTGLTFQQNKQQQQVLSASGYNSDALLENIQSAAAVTVASFNQSTYRYNGVYGRFNYRYDEKYILNVTGRRDGSSRFGPRKQFGNFWAAGASWLFYREKFIADLIGPLSFGKLRVSYGTSGSDQIPDYGYLDTYSATSFTYNGHKGLYPTRLVNADYSWEKSRKLDIGLETGFFNDRLTFNVDWFQNRSSSQLVGYPLSSVTGQTQIQYNLPAKVQNTGWEFELNTNHNMLAGFVWAASANITFPRNKLLSYPDLAGSSYTNTYIIGEPLNIRKTYHYQGVDPASGVYRFEDVDASGTLNAIDRNRTTFVGQKYYGGLQNTFRYKGLELDVFFQFVKQTGANYKRDVFGLAGAWGFNNGNQPAYVLDRWQKPGDVTNTQKFSQNYDAANPVYTQFSESSSYGENSYGDASFIRLKNVSLSWQLQIRRSNNTILPGPKLFIQGQNLATLTRYKGWDPEQASVGYLPPLKVLSAGFNYTF